MYYFLFVQKVVTHNLAHYYGYLTWQQSFDLNQQNLHCVLMWIPSENLNDIGDLFRMVRYGTVPYRTKPTEQSFWRL